jgi:hypothetical protein
MRVEEMEEMEAFFGGNNLTLLRLWRKPGNGSNPSTLPSPTPPRER